MVEAEIMYGTIARLQIKPEMGEQAFSLFRTQYQNTHIPGQVAGYVYQSDHDPNEIWMVAVFESREATILLVDIELVKIRDITVT